MVIKSLFNIGKCADWIHFDQKLSIIPKKQARACVWGLIIDE